MPTIPPQVASAATTLVKRALNSDVVRDAAAEIGTKVATEIGGQLAKKAESAALAITARAGEKITSLVSRPPMGVGARGSSPFAAMQRSSAARELTARQDTAAAGKMAQVPFKSSFSPIAAQAHAAFAKTKAQALEAPPQRLAIEAPPTQTKPAMEGPPSKDEKPGIEAQAKDEKPSTEAQPKEDKPAQPTLLMERERRPYSMMGSSERFDPRAKDPDSPSTPPKATTASTEPETTTPASHPKPRPAAKPTTKPAAEEPPAPTHEELMAQAHKELGIDKNTHWGKVFGREDQAQLMKDVTEYAKLTGQLILEPSELAGLIEVIEDAARAARNDAAAKFASRPDIKDSVAAALNGKWEQLQADCNAARSILDTMSAGSTPRPPAADRTKALDALGLQDGASMGEIRKSYHKLMLELHPDRAAKDPAIGKRRQEVQDAYDLLKQAV
ncbi:J domain-containing protein [Piscinibacter terrae]|uniref:J domain-containing protein n=1 Tax=Piscinibacter terrae TaxID=2496871 RepID=A0A3N7HNS5_9BURK|nr:J domain-containing protein [Albitalea terrae]RQP22756.1 hypothetical protein DZC73_20885 [Albitalea terrae]